MVNFACEHCGRTYVHRRNLVQHIKKNHADQESLERPINIRTELEFSCDQCGRTYIHRRNFDRHVSRNHVDHSVFSCNQCEKTFPRSGNLEKHKRTCVGERVTAPVAATAVKRRRISGGVQEFKVRRTWKSLGGTLEQFTIDMKEAKHLSVLEKAVAVFKPVMAKYQQDHQVYKFQIAVDSQGSRSSC